MAQRTSLEPFLLGGRTLGWAAPLEEPFVDTMCVECHVPAAGLSLRLMLIGATG